MSDEPAEPVAPLSDDDARALTVTDRIRFWAKAILKTIIGIGNNF